METFHKSPWQIFGEYMAPLLIGVGLLIGAFATRGEPLSLFFVVVGTPLASVVLWYRVPKTLTVSPREISIGFTFGKHLTIPLHAIDRRIYGPHLRLRYTHQPNGKQCTQDLGNAWRVHGKAITNEEIVARIRAISGQDFQP